MFDDQKIEYQHQHGKEINAMLAFHFNHTDDVLFLNGYFYTKHCRITLHCIEIVSDVILEILTYKA
jgi:hypothetical protein